MRASLLAPCGFAASIAVIAAACGGDSMSRDVDATGGSAGTSGGSAGTTGGGAGTTGGSAGTTGGSAGTIGGDENGGSSATAGTTDCVNPACPAELPASGDACSGCNFPPFGCSFDQQAVDGLVYLAVCANAQWNVLVQQPLNVTCCATDEDCFVSPCSDGCIEPVCVFGTCRLAYGGACWRDDQCSGDQACSGAATCGAGCTGSNVECGEPDKEGICVPKGQGCCLSDQDCNGVGHCVEGVCKVPSDTGGCYEQEDCGGDGQCVEVNVCLCGAACLEPDSEGHCEYMR